MHPSIRIVLAALALVALAGFVAPPAGAGSPGSGVAAAKSDSLRMREALRRTS